MKCFACLIPIPKTILAQFNPRKTMGCILMGALVLMLLGPWTALALGEDTPPPSRDQVNITLLKGEAQWRAGRAGLQLAWLPVAEGAYLPQGAQIRTAPGSRLEMRLADGSLLRLAANSEVELSQIVLSKPSQRFVIRLMLGRLWSNVRKTFGLRNRSAYRVQTITAVAGVRGTTFDVSQDTVKTTRVSVYSGQVGVSPPQIDPTGPGKEMAFPDEVTEEKWEEIILGKLQRLTVVYKGTPGKPETIDAQAPADEWVAWNQARDAQLR